jgi:hypothetical protein
MNCERRLVNAGLRTLTAWFFLVLAACSEDPQRLEAAKQPGSITDNWNEQHRERTQNQGEAERISP